MVEVGVIVGVLVKLFVFVIVRVGVFVNSGTLVLVEVCVLVGVLVEVKVAVAVAVNVGVGVCAAMWSETTATAIIRNVRSVFIQFILLSGRRLFWNSIPYLFNARGKCFDERFGK